MEFFLSPLRPDRFWGLHSFLFSGYQGLFPGNKAAGAWNWPFTFV